VKKKKEKLGAGKGEEGSLGEVMEEGGVISFHAAP